MTAIVELRSRASRFALVCFVILIGFTSSSAATLEDYRRRISETIAALEQLQALYDDDVPTGEQLSVSTIARAREQLPANETVMLHGQSIAVDNAWLHEALNQQAEASNSDRSAALARIVERLRAVGERLTEVEEGTNSAGKDESKARMAEILRRPEFDEKAAEVSAITRLLKRFLKWLDSLFPQRPRGRAGGSPVWSGIAQVIVIVISLAVIAFLVWRFLPRYLHSRGKKKQKREVRIVLGERLEADQTSADLLAQAEALARAGDLRAAIRKAYIAFLCELGDRKVISLAQHKTNRDYLNSVRERPPLYTSMRQLTRSFELHWYGFHPAGENDWTEFRNGFQQALKGGSG